MAILVKKFSIFVLALTFSAAAMPLYAFDNHEGTGESQEGNQTEATDQTGDGKDQEAASEEENGEKGKEKKKKEKPKCQPTGSRLQRC